MWARIIILFLFFSKIYTNSTETSITTLQETNGTNDKILDLNPNQNVSLTDINDNDNNSQSNSSQSPLTTNLENKGLETNSSDVLILNQTFDGISSVDKNISIDLYEEMDGKKLSEISYGNVVLDDRKWPENTFSYIIHESIPEKMKVKIQDIIEEYKNKTCVIFKEVPVGTEHAVTITGNEGGCSSFCGYDKNDPDMKIKIKGCTYPVEIKMLFALRLGLIQEHRRPDRDLYININQDNIREGKEKNFWTLLPEEIQDLKIPYDFTSITHFTSRAFRKPGTNTIEPQIKFKAAKEILLSKKYQLSVLDTLKINKLYDCSISEGDDQILSELVEYIKSGSYDAYVDKLQMLFLLQKSQIV